MKINSNRIYSIILSLIILILPIFQEQKAFNQSVNLVSMCVIFFIILVRLKTKRNKLIVGKEYFLFVVIVSLLSITTAITSGEYISYSYLVKGYVNLLLFFIIIILVNSELRETRDVFFKIYRFISSIAVLGIIVQSILYYSLGSRSNIQVGHITLLTDYLFSIYRPSSIFSEPAHFSRYIAPILAYELIEKRNLMLSLIFSIGIVLSTSALGIGLEAIVWIAFFYKTVIIERRRNKKFMYVLFVVVAIVIFYNLNATHETLQRLLSGGTIGPRFLRGVEIYRLLPNKYKLYGIGLQNLGQFTMYNSIVTQYDEVIFSEYTATIPYFACTLGVIGTLTFIFMLGKLFNKNTYSSKTLIIMFLYTCMFDNQFSVYSWVIFLITIYLNTSKSKVNIFILK